MNYRKNIEREEKFDVVVIGGGVAGFTAAVAAARNGAKTALLEEGGALGGILTAGGNPQIGIFYAYYRPVIAGIGWELCKNLEKQGFARIPDFAHYDTRQGGIGSNVQISRAMAEAEMVEMCLAAGVKLCFHTKVADVIKEKDRVLAVVAADEEGLKLCFAKTFIDATGDGDVAVFAGASYQKSDVLQPGTFGYTFTFTGELPKEEKLRADFQKRRESGEIEHGDFWPEYHAPIGNFFKEGGDNANHVVMDASSAESQSEAEVEGRRKMARMLRFASSETPITVYPPASYTAPRESRRIVGDYMLTKEDFLTGRLFEDSLSYGYYNIDLHTNVKGHALAGQSLPDGVVPAIPYRSLIVKGLENMLVAGRCASFDREVMSALRVKASCMGMGEVCGTAAALCENGEVRKVDLHRLKRTLTAAGAIVPSADLFPPAE